MTTYQRHASGSILRLPERTTIPSDPLNADWREYQEWLAAGNEPLPAPVPVENYVDKRTATYPPIAEQLDMLYWDAVRGTTTWRDEIARIKALYPKT
jgi:hypothetical protein